MRAALAISLVLLSLFSCSYASTCLDIPPTLREGQACGGGEVNCAYGLYCDTLGMCAPALKVGDACSPSREFDCPVGSSCILNKCTLNQNPGQACNSTLEDIPVCGSGLTCDVLTGKCTGGALGDTCLANEDCGYGLNCTGAAGASVCTGAKSGDSCTLYRCDIGLFCTSDFVCRPLLTSGKCNLPTDCAYGYSCIGVSIDDATQCTAFGTRQIGEYCGAEDRLCDSKRCFNSFCGTKSPKFCSDGGQDCRYDEVCTCGGKPLQEGTGRCKTNTCYEDYRLYEECIQTKCASPSRRPDYSLSCYSKNCKDLYDTYAKCNPGMRVAISALFLVASVLFAILF